MHAQRPGPTHVRILNDLPVDCTSVSLTASVCVAQQETRLFTRSRNRLSRANRMPDCLYQQRSSAGRIMLHSRAMQISIMLARTTPHSNSALCLPAAGALSSARRRARACFACCSRFTALQEPAARIRLAARRVCVTVCDDGTF
jgi:hypothetical protein